ncbi:YceI family protein [Tahibacter harae]|uniref:YceI family protein n=1 Tax=Tahibacter harae TaxID=2963937 RepID=A0ABT1QSL3_9GAMM|nr:YceI family protein [Tahibacter harae]MCQ4165246.1 YceI family protein [Tahibacter harae]
MLPRLPPLLLSLTSLTAAADDTRWRLDTVHTQIQFSIDHQGFNRSLGQFKLREGALVFDEKDWSSARVTASVDTASLYLGDAKWEETVRSWRYLNAERWPLAQFRSLSVQRGEGNSGVIHGELELHGQRRPLDIAFRFNKLANDPYTFKRTVGFSATATLRRSDFGMDKVLSAIGDEVQLRLEVTAVRDKDAEPGSPPAGDTSPTPAQDQEGNDGTEKR